MSSVRVKQVRNVILGVTHSMLGLVLKWLSHLYKGGLWCSWSWPTCFHLFEEEKSIALKSLSILPSRNTSIEFGLWSLGFPPFVSVEWLEQVIILKLDIVKTRVTLFFTACQSGWEEIENLRGNFGEIEGNFRLFEEIWEEIIQNKVGLGRIPTINVTLVKTVVKLLRFLFLLLVFFQVVNP